MIERRPDYYTKFRCLGGSCPDTCCQDWSVVPDEDALADYAAAPAPLRTRIAQNLVTDEGGDVCFRLDGQGKCALLAGDGLCILQRDWGEAHLCAHCAAYPRFTEEFGCLTETALAISCPEAARLLLEAPGFTLTETDDGKADVPFPGIDPDLLAGLEHSRAQALAFLNREDGEGLWEKLSAVEDYASRLQLLLNDGAYPALPDDSPRVLIAGQPPAYYRYAVRQLRLFAGLEPLRSDWPGLLQDCAARLESLSFEDYSILDAGYRRRLNPRWERQFTNLACYLIFRHWHKAANDDMLYGRAAFARAACTVLYHLALIHPGEEISLWSRFSREVEHDADNLDALFLALSQ